jgi:hypothetical protein
VVCLVALVLAVFNKKLFVADLAIVADPVEMRMFHLDYFRVILSSDLLDFDSNLGRKERKEHEALTVLPEFILGIDENRTGGRTWMAMFGPCCLLVARAPLCSILEGDKVK